MKLKCETWQQYKNKELEKRKLLIDESILEENTNTEIIDSNDKSMIEENTNTEIIDSNDKSMIEENTNTEIIDSNDDTTSSVEKTDNLDLSENNVSVKVPENETKKTDDVIKQNKKKK